MRAVELFEDLNHEDMDVRAPPSDRYFKEEQVAHELNNFLTGLIGDGFFDDCDLRGKFAYLLLELKSILLND